MPRRIACALLLWFSLSLSGSAQVTVNGVGSTFVYPILSKWVDIYHRQHPDIQIAYLPLGSGAGIAQTLNGMVDFGGTDAPVANAELSKAKIQILHVPVILGADIPAYNLPDVQAPLRFTGQLLADIFLGKVRNWNDPAIAALNQGTVLPNREITVVHRLDGSGTTYIWTDYLSKISSEWKQKIGRGTKVKWPLGVEANGNEGVSQRIQEVNGAIGYLELSYAEQKKILFGSVENAAGHFIRASVPGIEEAAASSDLPHPISEPPSAMLRERTPTQLPAFLGFWFLFRLNRLLPRRHSGTFSPGSLRTAKNMPSTCSTALCQQMLR